MSSQSNFVAFSIFSLRDLHFYVLIETNCNKRVENKLSAINLFLFIYFCNFICAVIQLHWMIMGNISILSSKIDIFVYLPRGVRIWRLQID